MPPRSIRPGVGNVVDDYVYVNMCSANIHGDHLVTLLDAEKTYGIEVTNYIQRIQCHGMTAEWRKRAAQWSLNILILYGVSRENVFSAMSILDRYLSL